VKQSRKGLIDRLIDIPVYASVRAAGFVVDLLGSRIGYALASLSARVWHLVVPSRLKIIDRNLDFAFPEGLDKQRRRSIRFECCRHAIANLAEGFLRNRRVTTENWRDFIDVDPIFEKFLIEPQPRGLAILSAHLGSWEMGVYFLGALGNGVSTIVRTLDNPYLDRYSARNRSRFGGTVIPKWGALRGMLKELRSGGCVLIMPDQSASVKEGYQTLFGVRTTTYQSYARVLVRQGCPVLFAVCVRDGFRFRFRSHGRLLEIPTEGTEDERADALVRNYLAAVEDFVLKYPEQYLWMHKRFKKRADGMGSPY
jgi:KDO2-lipid IV(A) lauroyltransferase